MAVVPDQRRAAAANRQARPGRCELERLGVTLLPITATDATVAARLPMHHRDPFDRILLAQPSRLDAVVVTRDGVFEQYRVVTLAVWPFPPPHVHFR